MILIKTYIYKLFPCLSYAPTNWSWILINVFLGLYTATAETGLEWAVIKGVSDFADDNKSNTDKWRAFASQMSASVVVNMLSDPGVFDDWPHHEVSIDILQRSWVVQKLIAGNL